MFVSTTCLKVRYAETDQMGIVHHSNYPVWFEAARTEFIKESGISYSKVEKKGLLLPLIELNCKYKSAAKYEDEILIKTFLIKLSFSRVSFGYEVYNKESGVLIASGETVHAWTDKSLKPSNIKKHFPDIYNLMFNLYN